MCVCVGCICPVSCPWLTLTVLWVVAPNHMACSPGRGDFGAPQLPWKQPQHFRISDPYEKYTMQVLAVC